MKKRLAMLIVCVLMTTALAACGSTGADAQPEGTDTTQETVAEAAEQTDTVTPEVTPEQVEAASEEEAAPEMVKICDNVQSGYETFGNAYGGVLIVKKDGKYGAVDYDMNQLVPCDYDQFRSANNKGYFVLIKEDEVQELYSPKGEMICSSEYIDVNLLTSGNCYIVNDMTNAKYYDYNGNLLAETTLGEDTMNEVVGSHDGIVLLRRYSENGNNALMEVGKLSEDGNVKWQTEYDGPISWEDNSPSDPNANGASMGFYIPQVLLSGINDGYYVTYHPVIEWGYMNMYDADSNKVADFNICDMDSEGNYSEGHHNEENEVAGYYYDGAWCYNRGTKMVWICGDKDVLVDVSDMDVLAIYDYIGMAEGDLWLAGKGDQWGYIDPDGNEIAMYDDASAFIGDYALIKEDGHAYLIGKDLEKIEDLGEADRISAAGELFAVEKDESLTLYQVR